MQLRLRICAVAFLAALVCLVPLRGVVRRGAIAAIQMVRGKKTVEQRITEFGPAARARMVPLFDRAKVAYPPARVLLVGLKHERQLEVWAAHTTQQFVHITTYPVRGASGMLGPKLREGDRQVPEGIYAVESINPNSLYHVSLRLDYPNAFDREHGRVDGRTALGGDIMIHGGSSSVGCIAVGDPASEELATLAFDTGIGNLTVVLTPVDFAKRTLPPDMPPVPAWTTNLYARVRQALAQRGTRHP